MSDDTKRGLYPKYNVTKADTGEVITNCIVLRPDRDPAARLALMSYSRHIAISHPQFAKELRQYLQAIATDNAPPLPDINLYESWGESPGDFSGWTDKAAGDPCPRCAAPLVKPERPIYDDNSDEVEVLVCEPCCLVWIQGEPS